MALVRASAVEPATAEPTWPARIGALAALAALAACGVPAPGQHDAAEDVASDIARDAVPDDGADGSDAVDAPDTMAPTDLDAARDASPDGRPDASPDAPPPDAPREPPFGSIPWQVVGTGVSYKDSRNPRGANVFIGYAGFRVDTDQARAWVTALYDAWLRDRGVRYVYAVQGPATVGYTGREIQNTRLIATLLPTLSPATHFIAVAGHSSGGWVACELLQQLYEGGLDPTHTTRGRTVYYDLDGVQECLDPTIVGNLRRAYFVGAHTNVAPGGWSLNAMYMMMGAMRLGSGGFHAYDASGSGCQPGASLCLHVSLINTHPLNPADGTPEDYASFTRGPVNTWYLSSTAADLPL